jgi:hypothetical protein
VSAAPQQLSVSAKLAAAAAPRPQTGQNKAVAPAAGASKAPSQAKLQEKPTSVDAGTLVSQAPLAASAQNPPAAAKPSEPKPTPADSTQASAQTKVAATAQPAAVPAKAATKPAGGPTGPVPTAAASAASAGALQRVAAELGAHSATNFYKGLGGNDVIDSGGIFVATYQVPEVGKNLLIRVSLPGGYEFEAKGVVRWTREPSPNSRGDDISPGFGAQFTEISPEARQLVYRYARNREPLFHDDM